MKWITLSGLPIEKLASAWLITRFIDPKAEILFAPENSFDEQARATMALPFEVSGVEFASTAQRSSFEQFLISYKINNPALKKMEKRLSNVKTGRDLSLLVQETGENKVTMEAIADDRKRFEMAQVIFDQIYSWSRSQEGEPNFFEPKVIKAGNLG